MSDTESKNKADARSIKSKLNMEKARQARLAKLKKDKETKELKQIKKDYKSESESESESDDERIIFIGKKEKPVKKIAKKKESEPAKEISKDIQKPNDLELQLQKLTKVVNKLNDERKLKKLIKGSKESVKKEDPSPKPITEIEQILRQSLMKMH